MSNMQKDWEADLMTESKEDLIEMVKHFQEIALGTYDPDKEEENYMLGVAVNMFTTLASCIHRGGTIEYHDETAKWNCVELADVITNWEVKYTRDNIRMKEK